MDHTATAFMALSKRKRLYCKKCEKVCWAKCRHKFLFTCQECESDINYYEAKSTESRLRKKARSNKAKELGTFESEEQKKLRKRVSRRGEPDFDYMSWIKSQECLVCEKRGVDAHHAVLKSQGGHDHTCVPLCPHHHNQSGESIHSLTMDTFEEKFGISILDCLRRLHRRYQERYPFRHLEPLEKILPRWWFLP